MRYGYILSTRLPKDALDQERVLKGCDCYEILIESLEDNFYLLRRFIASMTPKDVLIVSRVSSLGNTAKQIIEHITSLLDKNGHILSMDGLLDSRKPDFKKQLDAMLALVNQMLYRKFVYAKKPRPKNLERLRYAYKTLERLPILIRMLKEGQTFNFISYKTGYDIKTMQKLIHHLKEDEDGLMELYKTFLARKKMFKR